MQYTRDSNEPELRLLKSSLLLSAKARPPGSPSPERKPRPMRVFHADHPVSISSISRNMGQLQRDHAERQRPLPLHNCIGHSRVRASPLSQRSFAPQL